MITRNATKVTLNVRIFLIEILFDTMDGKNASNFQIELVSEFRNKYPELNNDLDFCFEVLAGKHKVGYTFITSDKSPDRIDDYSSYTIRKFYDDIIRRPSTTDDDIREAMMLTPSVWHDFFDKLVNRKYKLGYSNKNNMVTDKHCMLAKTYPNYLPKSGWYYIQEKLNGNRCIAYFENGVWKFTSRSQKPKDYPFNMSGLDPNRIYDGEVMTKGKMGNRDFATTSGLANSKYSDKSSLVYFIYDILDSEMPYKDRYEELCSLKGLSKDVSILKDLSKDVSILKGLSKDVSILKILPIFLDEGLLGRDTLYIHKDADNPILDILLDMIVAQGGEGLIIRDPEAPYYHSKNSGDRKPCLLKYKQVKTCDLRVVGFNEGKGKYEGMIGSLICRSDDGKVEVSVAGITDDIRASDPDSFIGQIMEIAYFDISQSKTKDVCSLQFPRFKCWRTDKEETSMF